MSYVIKDQWIEWGKLRHVVVLWHPETEHEHQLAYEFGPHACFNCGSLSKDGNGEPIDFKARIEKEIENLNAHHRAHVLPHFAKHANVRKGSKPKA